VSGSAGRGTGRPRLVGPGLGGGGGLRWKEEAGGVGARRTPGLGPGSGGGTRLKEEADGIGARHLEEAGAAADSGQWCWWWATVRGSGSGERQRLAVAACVSEWVRAHISGPVWEYLSCENSLTSGSPSIFGCPGGKTVKNDFTFCGPWLNFWRPKVSR
jgi:hypothetical protein